MTVETINATVDWVCPPGVTSVLVEALGGTGGATNSTSGTLGRPGSGGGAYSNDTVSVTPGVTYRVNVAAVDGPFTNGNDSWFGIDLAHALVLAKGSPVTQSVSAGGLGGDAAAGIGTVKWSGGTGGARVGTSGGGGGGAATASGNGANAVGILGGGSAPNGGLNTFGGTDGVAPGNGSSGGGANSGSGVTSGAIGQIILSYTPVLAPGFFSGFLRRLGQAFSIGGVSIGD